jgi:hypothetical protein
MVNSNRGDTAEKVREWNEHTQSDPQVFCGRQKGKETKERSGSTCWPGRARLLWQATAPYDPIHTAAFFRFFRFFGLHDPAVTYHDSTPVEVRLPNLALHPTLGES